MNKVEVLITFMLLFSFPLQLQAIEQWGVKLGYASSTQIWEHELIDQDDMSWRSGITASIYTQFFNYSGLSIITGLDYIQKGTGFEMYGTWAEPPLEKTTHYSLYHYLSVPILAKYTIVSDMFSAYFTFGPRIDYFVSYANDKDHMNWGFEEEWDNFVLEICTGIGVEKNIFNNQILSLEFQYYYEPLWQYDEYSPYLDSDIKMKNSTFTITMGYGFK